MTSLLITLSFMKDWKMVVLRDIRSEMAHVFLYHCGLGLPESYCSIIPVNKKFYLTFRLLSRTIYDTFDDHTHLAQLLFLKLYGFLWYEVPKPELTMIDAIWGYCPCKTRVKRANYHRHLTKCVNTQQFQQCRAQEAQIEETVGNLRRNDLPNFQFNHLISPYMRERYRIDGYDLNKLELHRFLHCEYYVMVVLIGLIASFYLLLTSPMAIFT